MNATDGNFGSLYRDSISNLRATFAANIAWVITGSIAIITNLLIIIMLAKQKSLKNCFQLNILHLAIADCLIGITFVFSGGKRLLCLVTEWGEVSSPSACATELSCSFFATLASLMQVLCIAVDRYFAVASPVFYLSRIKPKYFQIANISAWLMSFALVIPSAHPLRQKKLLIPNCLISLVFTKTYIVLYAAYLKVTITAVIALYIVIYGKVGNRLAKIRNLSGNIMAAKQEMETKVLKTCCWNAGFYFTTVFCITIASEIVSLADGINRRELIIPYLSIACGIMSSSSLLIYLWKSQAVRNDFLTFYWRKTPIQKNAIPAI